MYTVRYTVWLVMWHKLISDLLRCGLTEQEIVNRLLAKGIETTQPTINRIKSGEIGDPRYELGKALIDLRNSVIPKKPAQANRAQEVLT